jgi:toxin YoeB
MNLIVAEQAWEDDRHWHAKDRKLTNRMHALIKETARTPFAGIGKPEPLLHALSGYWSRRISDEHRMAYRVEGNALLIAKLRDHG